MKTIKLIILLLGSIFFFSSCVQVDLGKALDSVLGDIPSDYCDRVNVDSSFDPFIWESIIFDSLSTSRIRSKPLIHNSTVLLIDESKAFVSIIAIDKNLGFIINTIDTEMDCFYHVELVRDLLIFTGRTEILAYDANNFSLIWRTETGGQIHTDGKFIFNNDGNIVLPILKRETLLAQIDVVTLSTSNGQIIDNDFLYTFEGEHNYQVKIVSFSIDLTDNSILTVIRRWYPNREIDVLVIHRNLNSLGLNWIKESTLSDDYYPGALLTNNYAVFLSDSLYVLDKSSGALVSSKYFENNKYNHGKPILEEINNDVVLLRIQGQIINLVNLVHMNTIWTERDYKINNYDEGELYDGNYYTSTNVSLKKINLSTRTQVKWDELPYTCSYLSSRLSIDNDNGIMYIMDRKKLYAIQLD